MDDNNNQQLDAADAADNAAFATAWDGWALKGELAGVALTTAQLATVCRLWYGRGVVRGTVAMVAIMDEAMVTAIRADGSSYYGQRPPWDSEGNNQP